MDKQLAEIFRLVRSHDYDQARELLEEYIRQHPDQAFAWYLLSVTAGDRRKRFAAVKRAARLAPENPQIQERLVRMRAAEPPPWRRWALVAPLIGAVLLVVAAIVVTRPGEGGAAPVLPTLALLPSQTATGVIAAVPPSLTVPTDLPPASPAAEATESLASEASITAAQPTQANAPTVAVLAVTPTTLAPLTLPTAADMLPPSPIPTGIPPTQTQEPMPAPPTGLPSPLPPTVPPPSGVVALNTPVDINGGSLRVVASARPARSLIQELGGSAPNPPAGQSWVVVEMLLICSSSQNCAVSAADLRLMGSSGGLYTPDTRLSLEPAFGPAAYTMGQVWGYSGFMVPDSEAQLYLLLTQGQRQYAFNLQGAPA